jgi:epoxyqueuosine reductase
VICVANVYNTKAPYSTTIEDTAQAAISRYAWGSDYHDVLRNRLRRLMRWMSETAGSGLEAMSSVDSGPVQDRVFAEQAGLGWIGKNTCVINPQLGSWLFLGEILTNVELEPDTPGVDQCGTCTRCIDACPTHAIVEPYTVDATRCLSYLTIESRGGVEPSLRNSIGPQILGCDICQDVCPWNQMTPTTSDPRFEPREGNVNASLTEIFELTPESYARRFRGSAMKRAKLSALKRNGQALLKPETVRSGKPNPV